MMKPEEEIFSFLKEKGIPYRAFSHPVTDDLETKLRHDHENGIENAAHCKNLFLINRAGTRLYLLTIPFGSSFRTGPDSRAMGSGRLSFADPEKLMAVLRVRPGMVSPLELIFDEKKEVSFFLDESLLKAERICFHPANDEITVVLETPDFLEKFLPAVGRTVQAVERF